MSFFTATVTLTPNEEKEIEMKRPPQYNPKARSSKVRSSISLLALTAALASFHGGAAKADIPLFSYGDLGGAFALGTGFGTFYAPQANYGTGTVRSSETSRKLSNSSPAWAEGFLKPELKLTYHNGSVGTIFSDISAVGAATAGQGDANYLSTTYGTPARFDLEEAYVGYSTDMPFGNPGDTAILTLGRQAFTVGDSFLIGSGTVNAGQRSNYWMAPRTAFNGFGTLKLNAEPVRADIFLLQNTTNQRITRNTDQPSTTFAGINTEYFITAGTAGADGATNYADRQFYFGGTYLNILDASSEGGNANGAFSNNYVGVGNLSALNTYGDRKGMNVFDLHMGGNPISGPPIIADASFYGEFVRELNDSENRKVNATAYYVEPGYTLSSVYGKPHFAYRYAHFSGDKVSPSDGNSTKHAYDPLFYASGPRDFGTWYMGEIAGQYQLFNSNEDVHMLSASIQATAQIKLMANYYRFMLDQSEATLHINNRHFSDEFDLVGEYAYSAATNFALVGAVSRSSDAAKVYYQTNYSTTPGNYTYQLEGYVTINF